MTAAPEHHPSRLVVLAEHHRGGAGVLAAAGTLDDPGRVGAQLGEHRAIGGELASYGGDHARCVVGLAHLEQSLTGLVGLAEVDLQARHPGSALEVPGPCGTGLCHGCPLPVLGEDGVPRVVRACSEGPVVRADRVRWDSL